MTEDQAHNSIAKIRSADANGNHAEAYRESNRLIEAVTRLVEVLKSFPRRECSVSEYTKWIHERNVALEPFTSKGKNMREYGDTDQCWQYIQYLEWRLARTELFLCRHELPAGIERSDMKPPSFEEWQKEWRDNFVRPGAVTNSRPH